MSKKKKPTRLLTDVIDVHNRKNELARNYVKSLLCINRRFEKFLGRSSTTDDLRHKVVNEWLQHERDAGILADRTRLNSRIGILTIWKSSKVRLNVEKIRSIKVSQKNPEAWYPEELAKVIAAAKTIPGEFKNGMRRALYLGTIWQFAFEAGIRRRDIWNFDISTIVGEVAALTQHKTGKAHIIRLSKPLIVDLRVMEEKLKELHVENPNIVFRWPMSERQFYHWMRRCRKIAGVDADVNNRALQHMRRTGATEVDRQGGDAWRFLGHTARGLDQRSYIDGVKNARPTSPFKDELHGPVNNDRTPPVPIDPEGSDRITGDAESSKVAADESIERDPKRRVSGKVRFVVRRLGLSVGRRD